MRLARWLFALGLTSCTWVPSAHPKGKPVAPKAPPPVVVRRPKCPTDMVAVRGFCIDRYEAYVVEVGAGGRKTTAHSPYKPVKGLRVKAMNARGRVPQGYISRNQAEGACFEAGKRLCTDEEWVSACRGKRSTQWPYGDSRVVGRCNDRGKSSFNILYGGDGDPPDRSVYNYENMNDPRLNQLKGTLSKSGAFSRCKTSDGVYDMVGNLHEWTAAPKGTFRGGYYLDVLINGEGCDYRTTAHNDKYHDYSTGFRCCKTPGEKSRIVDSTAAPKSKGSGKKEPPKSKAAEKKESPKSKGSGKKAPPKSKAGEKKESPKKTPSKASGKRTRAASGG